MNKEYKDRVCSICKHPLYEHFDTLFECGVQLGYAGDGIDNYCLHCEEDNTRLEGKEEL